MKTKSFCSIFDRHFPPEELDVPTPLFEQSFTRSFFDPCYLVEGFTSIKVQQLLSLAFSCLPKNEAYFEVGTYQGKSLISALINNDRRPAYACDDFSQFTASKEGSEKVVQINLKMYRLEDRVIFYNADFRDIMNREHVPEPVGVYFYDAAHTEELQYQGIKLVEPLLADEALVIVDDWNKPEAERGTQRAIEESSNHFEVLYKLPTHDERYHAMWWDGVGVFRFTRNHAQTRRQVV